jgi:hypothetical protein
LSDCSIEGRYSHGFKDLYLSGLLKLLGHHSHGLIVPGSYNLFDMPFVARSRVATPTVFTTYNLSSPYHPILGWSRVRRTDHVKCTASQRVAEKSLLQHLQLLSQDSIALLKGESAPEVYKLVDNAGINIGLNNALEEVTSCDCPNPRIPLSLAIPASAQFSLLKYHAKA